MCIEGVRNSFFFLVDVILFTKVTQTREHFKLLPYVICFRVDAVGTDYEHACVQRRTQNYLKLCLFYEVMK